VFLLLGAIWAFNLVDLLFTMLGCQNRIFVELNPLVRPLGPWGQIGMKVSILAIATCVLALGRRRRLAEVGCWLLTTVYGILVVVWVSFFGCLLSPYHFEKLLAALS
jgi:hypothetical protein